MQEITTKLAYTVEEAAELLSLSRAHVYRLLDVGELRSISIGRSRRVTAGQLHAFIEGLERSSDNCLERYLSGPNGVAQLKKRA